MKVLSVYFSNIRTRLVLELQDHSGAFGPDVTDICRVRSRTEIDVFNLFV